MCFLAMSRHGAKRLGYTVQHRICDPCRGVLIIVGASKVHKIFEMQYMVTTARPDPDSVALS